MARVDDPHHYLDRAFEYYVTGRFAALNNLQVAPNLFHHAVEMLAKYCRMEVRAWSGAGGWEALLPGIGVVQVQPAGAVQALLWGPDRQAARQYRVLVPVAAGQVDSEAPQAG